MLLKKGRRQPSHKSKSSMCFFMSLAYSLSWFRSCLLDVFVALYLSTILTIVILPLFLFFSSFLHKLDSITQTYTRC